MTLGMFDYYVSSDEEEYQLKCWARALETFHMGNYVGSMKSMEHGWVNGPYIVILDEDNSFLLIDSKCYIHAHCITPLDTKSYQLYSGLGYTVWDKWGGAIELTDLQDSEDLML